LFKLNLFDGERTKEIFLGSLPPLDYGPAKTLLPKVIENKLPLIDSMELQTVRKKEKSYFTFDICIILLFLYLLAAWQNSS